MVYVLIEGPSYRDLDYEAREAVRVDLREALESEGILFQEYNWVWDERDRCLLLVGTYRHPEDARWWIAALESMGFAVRIRKTLPGEDPGNDPLEPLSQGEKPEYPGQGDKGN